MKASPDENNTDLFPPPPVEDGSFLVNTNSASLRCDCNNGGDIYIVDGLDNGDVDNGDDFGYNGTTANINIAFSPPSPIIKHDR
mmetsp:Transcript_14540/g.18329  ORF Transcript_14540/g.18329 Transcript_14540/m.18329 type:complete len:84 (+) Transcript_14540:582-833(+)